MSRKQAMQQAAKLDNISVEMVRKADIVCRTIPGAREQLLSGERTLEELWKLVTGDTSVGIHIKVQPELRDAINDAARDVGITRNELLNMVLRQIFVDYLPQQPADDSAENNDVLDYS